MNCNICGKNLFKDITFINIFKINYENHETCIKKLVFNINETIIPIDLNSIIYDYVFKELNSEYNENYLWCKYAGDLIQKHLKNLNWSMVIIYDEFIEYFIKNTNPYLLINLSKEKLLLISLKEENLSLLEGL